MNSLTNHYLSNMNQFTHVDSCPRRVSTCGISARAARHGGGTKKLFLIFYLLSINVVGQNSLVKQWDYTYGGSGTERLSSIIQTKDQGFLIGGWSTSDSSGDKSQPSWDHQNGGWDFWIVKLDSRGKKEWDKRFGCLGNDQFSSMVQTSDGGYLLGGTSDSDSSGDKTQKGYGDYDFWIIKIDSLGNKQWDRTDGGDKQDVLNSICQTKAGGFILGGMTNSEIGYDISDSGLTLYNRDFWIVKIDANGNKLWDKRYGGNHWDILYSMQATSDGGFLLGGSSQSDMSGAKTENTVDESYDFWVIKIDSSGLKQWDRDYGGSGDDELYSICETSDHGFILAGNSNSGVSGCKTTGPVGGVGDYDFWMVRIDSVGNKIWDKDFGGVLNEDEFGNVSVTSDNGFLLAGTSYSYKSGDKSEDKLGNEQSWIIKTDSNGNKEWDKTLRTNTDGDDEIGLAIQLRNGCFLFGNFTDANAGADKSQMSRGYTDYWITKYCDKNASTFTDCNLNINIAPNPTNSTVSMEIQNGSGEITLLLINGLGQILVRKNITSVENGFTTDIDLNPMSQGIYFVEIQSSCGYINKKVILAR